MNSGIVYLVGAGPGDPGLLTLRGRDLLQQADLVLYDGLVNPLLLNLATGVCERTARTRTGDSRIVPQQEINERLVLEAKAGKRVVRLKGGDPYIFGRGSEEAAALEEAGIPYEVVPGITAATAAGEYAGFSFTHREITSAVALVTGHEDPSRESSRLDYSALAAFPGTLVFYMGLGRIETICRELVENGRSPATPAAVICKASLPQQQVVTSNLADLAREVTENGLVPPSLIVVGECINLREASSWFERRPLLGVRVGITRPTDQCEKISQRIIELSGQPVVMPLISISPIDQQQKAKVQDVIDRLCDYDWIVFTSVNGVSSFFEYLFAAGKDVRAIGQIQIASIGPSVEKALQRFSLKSDVVPETFRAEALAEVLADHVDGQQVLWPRANRARQVLPETLEAAGAKVTGLEVYVNDDVAELPSEVVQQMKNGEVDWIGLSSPSIARQMAQLLKSHEIDLSQLSTRFATISPVTSAAAVESGLSVAAEATTHTWDGIVDAIIRINS